jgi:hypothetical protein
MGAISMYKVLRWMGAVMFLGLTAGVASAAPGWAYTWRPMSSTVPECRSFVSAKLRQLTGNEPQVQIYDHLTTQMHVYWGEQVIFATCGAAAGTVCDEPRAGLKLIVTDSNSSEVALDVLNTVNAAIVEGQRIDCGPALDPR